MAKNILTILDEIRAIATEGMTYAKDNYDLERYKKLLEMAGGEYSQILDLPKGKIIETWKKEFGCITPKLGADVAIINSNNEFLIIKRTDDMTWSLPCGWVDVGESPYAAAIRESKEETGLDINPVGYIAVTSKGPHLYPRLVHQVNVLIAAKPSDINVPIMLSHEHSQYRWINKKEAENIDWHPGHERLVRPIFNYLNDGKFLPDYD